MKVIVDTGPIIALSKTAHLTLLPRLFEEIVVPQSVLDEVAGPGETRAGAEIADLPWVRVESDEVGRKRVQARHRLGDGEAEAVALAQRDPAGTFLLVDDDSAFKAAARLGIQTVRTGAVLVMAVKDGLLSAAAARQALSVLRAERYISAAVERAILGLLRRVSSAEPE